MTAVPDDQFAGMAVTAVTTYGVLMFEGYGIALWYIVELFIAHVDWASAAVLPAGDLAETLPPSIDIIRGTPV